MKKVSIITILLILSTTVNCLASSVFYLPDVTREMSSAYFWTDESNILSYDDAFDISEYAIPAMQYDIGTGIINGKTSSTVNPKDNTTRAEIAVILHRFIEKVK